MLLLGFIHDGIQPVHGWTAAVLNHCCNSLCWHLGVWTLTRRYAFGGWHVRWITNSLGEFHLWTAHGHSALKLAMSPRVFVFRRTTYHALWRLWINASHFFQVNIKWLILIDYAIRYHTLLVKPRIIAKVAGDLLFCVPQLSVFLSPFGFLFSPCLRAWIRARVQSKLSPLL